MNLLCGQTLKTGIRLPAVTVKTDGFIYINKRVIQYFFVFVLIQNVFADDFIRKKLRYI